MLEKRYVGNEKTGVDNETVLSAPVAHQYGFGTRFAGNFPISVFLCTYPYMTVYAG
jgi:hypothetical protein